MLRSTLHRFEGDHMRLADTITHLQEQGIDFQVHEHEAFRSMDEVVLSGRFQLQTSLKALAFCSGDRAMVAVVPGETRLNYAGFARACGVGRKSLRALRPDEVVMRLGDTPGGVSPFHSDDITVVFDESIVWMTSVTCGSGDPHHTIELDSTDLLRSVKSTIAPIAQLETTSIQ